MAAGASDPGSSIGNMGGNSNMNGGGISTNDSGVVADPVAAHLPAGVGAAAGRVPSVSLKRRRSESPAPARPDVAVDDDVSHHHDDDVSHDDDDDEVAYSSVSMVDAPAIAAGAPTIPQSEWQHIVANALPAVVSIRFSQVASFDTEPAVTSEASGFVVDAERGLILTNRHVVCSGPFVGEAIWHDHEETDVFPVYRDPIHDFGFLRFDPKKIRYIKLQEIELAPELAQVGLDIRVVGNDAGEKLSILAGSISRLDRNAPLYGDLTYNDFNTFYLQAASSTSGGSSGSPVLSIEGKAVGLQAGGHTKAATDFFLPLDRVKRALGFIREGKQVPRGTIQTQFLYRPFDEVRRLGLTDETEAIVRNLDVTEIGMLVVEVVVPKGPAAGFLEEGDILVSVNGRIITKFFPLEDILDNSIGSVVQFKIERGGIPLEVSITVQDLHSITPDRLLSVGGATFNNLSYQLARQFCVAVEGVHLTEASGMFRIEGSSEDGWIISSVDTTPTPNLEALMAVLKRLPDRARVPVTYYSIADVHTSSVAVVDVERHWSRFVLMIRNDKTGLWTYEDMGDAIPQAPILPMNATFPSLDESLGPARNLLRSIVKVNMYMPWRIEGFPRSRRQGAGLVLDAERGIVVVGRGIVPYMLGDITIVFADSIIIPGKIEYLHPTQNVAFVSYDPKLIGTTPVESAPISNVKLAQGHSVYLVALNHNHRPVCTETTVTDMTPVKIPLNSTPRFRAINFESITLATPLADQCSSGVLSDAHGCVQGLWLNFIGEHTASGRDNEYHMGMHISVAIDAVLPRLRLGQTPSLVGLAAEFMTVQISQSRNMGLTDAWVRRVEQANPSHRQLFMAKKVETESLTATVLRDLDLILSVEGKVVSDVSVLDVRPDTGATHLDMVVLRDKTEMSIRVPLQHMSGDDTDHIVCWAGAILQAPHKAVRQQSKTMPSRVYVSGRSKGSPAYTYGLTPTQWITHVNGEPTHTLTDFVRAVRGLPDNTYVRVKTVSFDLVPWVLSVKVVKHYWPTVELVRDHSTATGWRKIAH